MKWNIWTALLLTLALLSPSSAQATRHLPPVRHFLNGRYGWFRTTQYIQCCITASGRPVFYGEVAAPYWIPFYAHVVLPGIGTFIALDRSAFNDRIDIYVPYYPYPGIPDWVRGAYWY